MAQKKLKSINISQFINVQKLCLDNELDVFNKEKIQNWREIKRPSINRVGLEIIGHFEHDDIDKNIIGFGTKESTLMSTIPRDELENNLKKIFEYLPPLAICSSGVSEENKKLILKHANNTETPVVFVDTKLSFITTTVGIYIAENFAPEDFVHGSLVIINGIGVLIIGDSGVGKSEAVLELIQRGHMFVSDDSVIIKRIGNNFIGVSPEITKNILEARGLGLINIKSIYGEKSVKDKTNIDLVIELKKDENTNFDRLGNENHFYNVLNGKIKKILIPIKLGRNTASLIEVATSLYISKKDGVDAFQQIQERIKNEQ